MNILKLLATDSFLSVNKHIASELGLEAATLLAELASAYNFWESEGRLDGEGMFFETVEQIEKNTTLTKHQQAKAVKVLEDAGVLTVKKKGLPAKRYFLINEQQVVQIVDHKKLKNCTTVGQKSEPLVVEDFNPNKNISNKNLTNKNREINKNYNSSSIGDGQVDYDEILTTWNQLESVGIKPIRFISGKRKDAVRARLRQYGKDAIIEAIWRIKESDFLVGKNNRGWVITFDWFMKPSNFPKVLEGNYENSQHQAKSKLQQQLDDMENWGKNIGQSNIFG